MIHLDTTPTPLTLLQQIWDSNVTYNHTFSAMLWSDDRIEAIKLTQKLAEGVGASYTLCTAQDGNPPPYSQFQLSLFGPNERNIVLLDTPLFEAAQCQRFLFNIFAERTVGFHPLSTKTLVIGLGRSGLETPYKKGAVLGQKMMHVDLNTTRTYAAET